MPLPAPQSAVCMLPSRSRPHSHANRARRPPLVAMTMTLGDGAGGRPKFPLSPGGTQGLLMSRALTPLDGAHSP